MHLRCGYRMALGTGFDALLVHLQEVHGEEVAEYKESDYHSWREFDTVLSLSGRGHKEKNILSVLIEYNFDIIFEPCMESLGFVSPKQKLLLRKAKDHHKTFDFLMIVNESLEMELARIAVKEIKRRAQEELQQEVGVMMQEVEGQKDEGESHQELADQNDRMLGQEAAGAKIGQKPHKVATGGLEVEQSGWEVVGEPPNEVRELVAGSQEATVVSPQVNWMLLIPPTTTYYDNTTTF